MSRIRTIKPEFWRNEKLSALSEATLILAAALLNYADDEGYFNANAQLVKAECSPLRDPSVTIHCSLTNLSNVGYLKLGTGADGRRYGRILKFTEHQKINRPKPSKISRLQITWDVSGNDHCGVTDASPPEQGTGNREQGTGNREQGRGADAPPRDDDLTLKVFGGDHGQSLESERVISLAAAVAGMLAKARNDSGGGDPDA